MERLHNFNSSPKTVLAFSVLLFLFMLALNFLTPYVADDYVYLYSFVDKSRLDSLEALFRSMYAHCFYMNGRVVSHFLGQFFLMFPKAVFNVVNALAYTVLMALMYRLATMRGRGNFLVYLAICAAFWHFLPAFGQVALWTIGSVNYLWALLWGALYLLPFAFRFYYGEDLLARPWQKVLFCLFAFPFGMYTEITSFIGILVAVLLLLLAPLMKKARLIGWLWLPVLLSAAGFAVMLMMPAELSAKTGSLTLYTLFTNFRRSTQMLQTHCLPLLLSWAAAFVLGLYAKIKRERLVLSLVMALGAVAANYMLIAATYYEERCVCTTIMLLIVAIGHLVIPLCESRFQLPCACVGILLAMSFAFSLTLGSIDILNTWRDFRYRETVIAESLAEGERDLVLDRVWPHTKYSAFYGLRDLATDTWDTWPNSSMAKYYGADTILGR